MLHKILDISAPAYINVRNNCLQLNLKGDKNSDNSITRTVSHNLDDIDTVILSNPENTITQLSLGMLSENNISVIILNKFFHTVGAIYPYLSNSVSSKRLNQQVVSFNESFKCDLWQNILMNKIINQSKVLDMNGGCGESVRALVNKVVGLDKNNVEGLAAKRYWNLLFGNKHFVRKHELYDGNVLFNYAYGILRSIVCKNICAHGLHPSFGIKHCNQYNSFVLADDLMEPFRPVIDMHIYNIIKDFNINISEQLILSSELKKEILQIFSTDRKLLTIDNNKFSIITAIQFLCEWLLKKILNNTVQYSPIIL